MKKLLLLTILLLNISLQAQILNFETAEEEAYCHSIQDLSEFNLYTKECNNGIMKSCNGLAYIYFQGKYVREDKPKALELYEKACNGGYIKSCSLSAMMLESGNGVKQDLQKAAKYLEKACYDDTYSGSATSCLLLGTMYGKNTIKAEQYYKLGCEKGNKTACKYYEKANK